MVDKHRTGGVRHRTIPLDINIVFRAFTRISINFGHALSVIYAQCDY